MEETFVPAGRDCANCGQSALPGDHPTPLCADCRAQFLRYPIPHWIRAFAGAVIILVVYSLFTFPKDLSAGIALEKGKKAEKEKKYITAQREMEKVLEKIPRNVEARGHLVIDAFYNQDYETMGTQLENVRYSNFDDHDLVGQIEYVISKASPFFPDSTDPFITFKIGHEDMERIPDTAWVNYMRKHPRDIIALATYGDLLFKENEFDQCDSCMRELLTMDKEFVPALRTLSSIKRQQHKLDSALYYNDQLLSINKELPDGLASKARTLLMQKKDRQALAIAEEACRLGKDDVYSQVTLIMAYHFNNRMQDRDALVKKVTAAVAADSSYQETFQYAMDVITNKEKFRD